MNLANKLTILRILLVPVFIVFMAIDNFHANIIALVVFCIAALTDFFDGKIARSNNTITTFGIFLDPLADKLLVTSAFISFVELQNLAVPAWMVICIISREFMITGLRSIAASQGVIIPANNTGKIKTTSQMITIIAILVVLIINAAFVKFFGLNVYDMANGPRDQEVLAVTIIHLPYILMLITTILTLYSGFIYIINNRTLFFNTETEESK